MSGERRVLSEEVCKLVDPADVSIFRLILEFVLEFQIVCEQTLGHWFEVRCGSGMGQKHSGTVSDAALFALMELGVLTSPSEREKWGIQAYVRYREDILLIMKTPRHV